MGLIEQRGIIIFYAHTHQFRCSFVLHYSCVLQNSSSFSVLESSLIFPQTDSHTENTAQNGFGYTTLLNTIQGLVVHNFTHIYSNTRDWLIHVTLYYSKNKKNENVHCFGVGIVIINQCISLFMQYQLTSSSKIFVKFKRTTTKTSEISSL